MIRTRSARACTVQVMADQSGQINQNAQNPASASSDAGSVVQHPIPSQIAGDRYAAAVTNARGRNRGVRFSKISPAGPVSDQQATNPSGGVGFDEGDGL